MGSVMCGDRRCRKILPGLSDLWDECKCILTWSLRSTLLAQLIQDWCWWRLNCPVYVLCWSFTMSSIITYVHCWYLSQVWNPSGFSGFLPLLNIRPNQGYWRSLTKSLSWVRCFLLVYELIEANEIRKHSYPTVSKHDCLSEINVSWEKIFVKCYTILNGS